MVSSPCRYENSLTSRQIDVHYSLPRADEQTGRCDGDKNQVSLQ
jgi:hypothetical protein